MSIKIVPVASNSFNIEVLGYAAVPIGELHFTCDGEKLTVTRAGGGDIRVATVPLPSDRKRELSGFMLQLSFDNNKTEGPK